MGSQDKLGEIFVEIKAKTDGIEKELKSLKSRLDADAKKMGNSFGGMFSSGLSSVFKLAAGFLGLQQAVNFGKKILSTTSEFEQLRTRLVSLYGDADKAQQVFNGFKKIASTTPFSLKGVVEAGAQLKAFGLNAEDTLKPVTDLAAFMGMDVVEAANAVGRAFAGGAGAADILRERGVLNLIKSFKGVDDLTKLTLPEFRKALIETMQNPAAGIAGSTDRMSKTFAGAFSNMQDAIDNFAAALGGGVLSGLGNLIKQVTGLFEAITPTKTALDEVKEKAFELSYNFDSLTSTYLRLHSKTKLTKEETNLYRETIQKLQAQYPNYFKNIDLQKGKFEDVKIAIANARVELDKYINSLMQQAIIEQNKDKIGQLAAELGKYTIILNGLKNAQNQINKTGVDPFSKLTASQRGKLIEQGDLTIEYRTANIFNPLDKQIENVERKIKGLEIQKNKLSKIIDEMVGAFKKEAVSPPTEAIKATNTAEKTTIENTKDKIELLKKEKSLYDELYPATEKWYNKSLELIKAQTKELIDSGVSKANALEWEKKRVDDLRESYERVKIKIEDINKLRPVIKHKVAMAETSGHNKPEHQDKETEDIIGLFESYKEASKFTFFDALLTSEAMAREAMAGFFEDIYIKGKWANSMLEKAFVGMANAFISQVQRMITEWLAFEAIKTTFKFLGIPLPNTSAPTASGGGTFIGTNNGVKKMATGGSFIVPSGFPNDSYPMFVQSGERVTVNTPNQIKSQEQLLAQIIRSINVLNANLVSKKMGNEVFVSNNVPGSDFIVKTIAPKQNLLNRQRVKMERI